jgi:hypothetical protein
VAFYACEVSSEIGTERVNKRIVNTAFKNSERIYAVIKNTVPTNLKAWSKMCLKGSGCLWYC